MQNSTPLVTLGIPNYNYAHYIKEALNSVTKQTYQNIEIIIVDDCSTDNSLVEIESWIENYSGNFEINLIKNETNLGLTGTCNVILKNAKGKYFQTLDADDIILPEKIEKQVVLLEGLKNTALVYSNSAVINDKSEITNIDYCSRIHYDKNRMPAGFILEDLLVFNFISLPSVLINTQYAREVGGFDEKLRVQDYYLWLKLSEKYSIAYLPEVVACYRVHKSSMTNSSGTNPAFTDSILQLKYNYYKNCNRNLKKVIKKNIQYGAVYLYQFNYLTSKKWLWIAFRLNPGIKTFLYYIAIQAKIRFSFFNKIKSQIKRLSNQK